MVLRALVVEGEAADAAVIRRSLTAAGCVVELAADGARGLEQALRNRYALIVLAQALPDGDGLAVCHRLREGRCDAPILLLTAGDAVEDRIAALDAGADACLPKPFHAAELHARAQALVRPRTVGPGRPYRIGDLMVDPVRQCAARGGRDLTLTHREFTLLEAMAAHPGRVLSPSFIQRNVWRNETSSSNMVAVVIRRLRRVVDAGHPVRLIHSIYGEGYTLADHSHQGGLG